MAEATNNTFTVFRRQVIQTGDYEPAEASCSVTITVDDGASQEDISKSIAQWGETLEVANYEALGVGYEMTESGVRMLSKSVSGTSAPAAVAVQAATNSSNGSTSKSGGSLQDVWRDLMDNSGGWWDPNWVKKLEPDSKFNKNGPDYKRKEDGKGIWLTKKDGTSLVPNWFVCPFTGKDSDALSTVGSQIRA